MTPEEEAALRALAEAWNAMLLCVTDPQSRQEACAAIHVAQNIVLAQPTIRARPDLLRQSRANGRCLRPLPAKGHWLRLPSRLAPGRIGGRALRPPLQQRRR